MNTLYALFAECPVFGSDPAYAKDFAAKIFNLTARKDVLVMADKHIMACPNFRLALRAPETKEKLYDLIHSQKIVAAKFEGYVGDGTITHFSFNEFHRWYSKFNLWPASVAPEIKDYDSDDTKAELRFFDDAFKVIPVPSFKRDHLLTAKVMENLNHPVLVEKLAPHHEAFKKIAHEVHGAVQSHKVPMGIIYIVDYPGAGDVNMSKMFEKHLVANQATASEISEAKKTIGIFGQAMLIGLEIDMVGARPVFSSPQAHLKAYLQRAQIASRG